MCVFYSLNINHDMRRVQLTAGYFWHGVGYILCQLIYMIGNALSLSFFISLYLSLSLFLSHSVAVLHIEWTHRVGESKADEGELQMIQRPLKIHAIIAVENEMKYLWDWIRFSETRNWNS